LTIFFHCVFVCFRELFHIGPDTTRENLWGSFEQVFTC